MMDIVVVNLSLHTMIAMEGETKWVVEPKDCETRYCKSFIYTR